MSDKFEQERAPSLSLGLPVYNGERHLEIALNCLLEQTFRDFEIVISDNASTDRTPEICRDFAAKDSRIRYSRNDKNIGASPNYNKTFHAGRGKYFKWVAHDDYYSPRLLERCVETLEASPGAVLAHTEVLVVDGEGRPLPFDPVTNANIDTTGERLPELDPPHVAESDSPARRFDEVLHRIHWCCQIFGVIRTDILRHTGLQRSYYGADKVVLAELALAGKFVQVDGAVFHKRVHGGMTMKLNTAQKRKWIDANLGFHIPQLLMLRDYVGMVRASELPLAEKMRCFGSIGRLFTRPGVWHRVFVPGPDNYFGLDFRLAGTRKASTERRRSKERSF